MCPALFYPLVSLEEIVGCNFVTAVLHDIVLMLFDNTHCNVMVLSLLELARELMGRTFIHTGNGSCLGGDRLVNFVVLGGLHSFFMVFSSPFCHQTRSWFGEVTLGVEQ